MTFETLFAVVLLYFLALGAILNYKGTSENTNSSDLASEIDDDVFQSHDVQIARNSIQREGLILAEYKTNHNRESDTAGSYAGGTGSINFLTTLRRTLAKWGAPPSHFIGSSLPLYRY